METLKQLIAEQIQSIVTGHIPYQEKLTEVDKKDLEDFSRCLLILQRDNKG